MPKVVFVKEKREIEVPEGANLRDEALKAGIQVNFEAIDTATGFLGRYLNCHGLGLCGTCRVLVKKGMENLRPKSMSVDKWRELVKQSAEGQNHAVRKGLLERITLGRMMFANIGIEDEVRLACQVCVQGDVTIETRPEFNLCGENFWQKPYPNK